MPAPLRVLVVDDDQAVATGLALVLESLGHLPQIASSGQEALDLLQTFHPAIAFIDIEMPGMDGHEVARRIRELPECSKLLIVAFTSSDEDTVRRHLPRCEFVDHLPKPYRPEGLRLLLQSVAEWQAVL